MSVQVVVLNGGSSSGKTSIGRRLQEILPQQWLLLGADTLVDAMPPSLLSGGDGIGLGAEVTVGADFAALDAAWSHGVGEMARAGAHVIIDDVFLGGAKSQQRWRDALAGLTVCWVGVHCAPQIAAAREAGRGDRAAGMAANQAEQVHLGVDYDLVVDSGADTTAGCAAAIAALVAAHP